MIVIDKLEVSGLEAAVRGMRNPMNSWDKSDSILGEFTETYDENYKYCGIEELNHIGPNDLALMMKLIKAGTDHSKFLRMINVTVDITAPLYWWKEFDTYKVGTVRNSCSTMHKIHSKKFEPEDFSYDHLKTFSETDENGETTVYDTRRWLMTTINQLNWARDKYLKTNDKVYWWQMIQLLPSSYKQKATVQMNYAVIRNMYHSRYNHKLDEWQKFCEWMKGELPYSVLVTM